MKHASTISLVLFLTLNSSALAGMYTDVQKEKQYAEPTDDSAIVYVVRPAVLGKAVRIWAFVDKQSIGVNRGKQYTFARVLPGEHTFWAKAENISAIEFEVEAGKTYYLKQTVKMGAFKARVKLIQIDEVEGKEGIEKCKFTRLTPEGQERAEEIAAKKWETAVGKLKE